mmetsp:Transcript_5755/g.11520  ORF Transcript_5755/g.11520 Transcript_5755/m.11520 type:complete len:1102 (+) Transcript_5755:87-3392(+)
MIQAGLIVRRARVINIGSIRRNYSTTSLLRLSESISSSRRIKWVKLFSTFSSSNCTLGVKIILPRILTRKCDEKGNITTKKSPSPSPSPDPISLVSKGSFSAQPHVIFQNTFSSTANGESASNSENSDAIHPISKNQAKLLERTETLLSDDFPAGTLTVSQLIDVSNCIFLWINTGEHRYLGAKQAELLIKRLILERGGGKSLGEIDNENTMVEWDMLKFEKFVIYINSLYHGQDFTEKILSIVSFFEKEYISSTKTTTSLLDCRNLLEVPYKSIISTLCKRRTGHAAATAEQVLHRFETRLSSSSRNKYDNVNIAPYLHSNPPTVPTYNNVISCWFYSNSDNYPRHYEPNYFHDTNPASNILYQMLHLYNLDPENMERIRPDYGSFNMAIASLSELQKNGNGFRSHQAIGKTCFDHLSTMIQFYKDGYEDCAPDYKIFLKVLNALELDRRRGNWSLARKVLEEMLHLSGTVDSNVYWTETMHQDASEKRDNKWKNVNVFPRTKDFNIILAMIANADVVDQEKLDYATNLVDLMEHLVKKERSGYDNESFSNRIVQFEGHGNSYNCKPDIFTYNTLISIAANAGRPEVAEETLKKMAKKSAAGDFSVKPDKTTFNTVISAWARSKTHSSGDKAAGVIHLMQKMADEGDESVRPDRISLTSVMNSLISSAKRSRNAPLQAEDIIQRMEQSKDSHLQPDTVTYTSLIKCWGQKGGLKAAERAEKIIDTLHKRYDDGYIECKPDSYAYNVALDTIAKSGVGDAAERAEAVLNRMKNLFNSGKTDLAPTTESFATVMNALARSGNPESGVKAEELLQTMHNLQNEGISNVEPNTIAYTTCIMAWRNSGHKDAGKRASFLLKKMEEYYDEGLHDLRPNVITYTNVMEAWISSGQHDSFERVKAILDHMIHRSKTVDSECAPTTICFNVALKAIRLSSEPMKDQKAQILFDRMKEMHESGDVKVKPSIQTYNAFFSACALTEGSPERRRAAFSIAIKALLELQKKSNMHADSYTWPAVWKLCENLLDAEKDISWINRVFEYTVKSGAINELLFNNIRRFLPKEYLKKKIKTEKDVYDLTVHDLPSEWTRNVTLGKQSKKNQKKGRRK